MTNPILVEVTRSGQVESRHRGAIAIVDDVGTVRFAVGDIEIPVFPRSALKAIQALPLVESGAADAFGFGEQELALAQSSHGGEARHVGGVRAMLAAIGLDEAALECGAHDPHNRLSATRLAECGEKPGAIHNNCSGKHAGFLAIASHLCMDPDGYVKPDHPVQILVRDAVAELTGVDLKTAVCGIDGCSIPTYAIPLRDLAKGFARFASRDTLLPARATAARRLMDAALAKPDYLAGTGQFAIEQAVPQRARSV
ncbi:MAG: asparaginase [Alphaproteobacteria bacterium]